MGFGQDDIIVAFAGFDKNNNGKIDADELSRILTTMGEKFSSSEMSKFLDDAGNGSSIDYDKFVKKMNKLASSVSVE